MKTRRTTFVLAVLALIVAAAGLWSLWVLWPRANPAPRPVAVAAEIGGPFALTDQRGERVTDVDLRGHYLLIYFGYTYCPDVCPTELQDMARALDLLGDKASRVTPVFITIDPARDRVAVMADYVAHFHPRLIGLTGTDAEIAQAAKAYRVYYAKVESTGDVDGDSYLMDHSSYIYLVDPEGRFLTVYSYGQSPEDMAADVAARIDAGD